jgi:hypothetical protein
VATKARYLRHMAIAENILCHVSIFSTFVLMVFEEFSELCDRTRKVKNYVEKFRTHEEWQELEHIVRNKVGKLLANNRKFLENVLVSLVGALSNDPDRYLLLDRME